MTASDLLTGYVLTHPHDPYDDEVALHINKFDGDMPWQAQVYVQGSLIESDYFSSEVEALSWASREVVLLACVLKSGEAL